MIIYLDPYNSNFIEESQFRARFAEGRDGNLREQFWVFKEVGVETIFDKMLISGERQSSEKVYKREEDDLLAAMNAYGMDDEDQIKRDEDTGAGKIVVTFERVTLGDSYVDYDYRAKHHEDQDMDVDRKANDITHTTG